MAIGALAPLRSATAQTITVTANIPVEVSDPANLSAAAAFAWGEFIALTWPALPQGENNAFPRGQPDTSLKYGDKGKTGQVVWETFRHKSEAFPGKGNPNGYDPTAPDFGFGAKPDYVYQSTAGSGIPPSGEVPPLNKSWNPKFHRSTIWTKSRRSVSTGCTRAPSTRRTGKVSPRTSRRRFFSRPRSMKSSTNTPRNRGRWAAKHTAFFKAKKLLSKTS
jgi:hypothetical protein